MSSVEVPMASSSSTPSSRAESESERLPAPSASRRCLSAPRALRSVCAPPANARSLPPCTDHKIPTDRGWRIDVPLPDVDEADCITHRVYAASDLVAGVALDRVNLAVRVDT